MTTQQQEEEKRYDPGDSTLKFVNRQDDLDPLDDDTETLKAEMSCGHAVTPESLTGWCRSLLDQSQFKFLCPALEDGTFVKCGAEWSYQECPVCETFVEREDLTNLSVLCTVCTADKGQRYEFCWQCLKQWKGPAPRSDRCDNDGCINQDLELLKNCETTSLPQVAGVTDCPSIRACPTCGQRVEHDKTGCKNILCPRCNKEFCFVCLKLTEECLETSSYFTACSAGVAPRQTSIPTWNRN